jgi:protein involved in polysaccharide export with SLBB domain
MKRIIYFTKVILLINSFFISHVFANPETEKLGQGYELRDLALPSDTKDLSKGSGSIYYNPSVKGKVLIPVNIWGEVNKSGLHFVPIDSTLTSGLSMAGGPSTYADLRDVKVMRKEGNKFQSFDFDLSEGGEEDAHSLVLKPGDSIFVERERFYENRAYYTSLISVVLTVLSSILLYREVRRD